MRITRRFGVEIEVVHADTVSVGKPAIQRRAHAALQTGGVSTIVRRAALSRSHGGSTPATYRVEPDATVDAEIVSPPMRDTDTLNEVMRILSADGFGVNTNCGQHVHIEAINAAGTRMSFPDLRRLFAIWAHFEPTIETLVAPSRRNNHFSRRIATHTYTQGTAASQALAAPNFQGLSDDFSPGKFYAVNIRPFATRGTIEFRLHNGTLEANKIEGWIRLCAAIMDRSQSATDIEVQQVIDSGDRSLAALVALVGDGAVDAVATPAPSTRHLIRRRRSPLNRPPSFRSQVFAFLDEQAYEPATTVRARAGEAVRDMRSRPSIIPGAWEHDSRRVLQIIAQWRTERLRDLRGLTVAVGDTAPVVAPASSLGHVGPLLEVLEARAAFLANLSQPRRRSVAV